MRDSRRDFEPSAGLIGWFIKRYCTVQTCSLQGKMNCQVHSLEFHKTSYRVYQLLLHLCCHCRNARLLLSVGHIVVFDWPVHFGIDQGDRLWVLLSDVTFTRSRFYLPTILFSWSQWNSIATTVLARQLRIILVYGKESGQIFLFYQLWLSIEHHMEVSINTPGRGSVSTFPAETRLLLSRRERWLFYYPRVTLTLIHWLGPPFFYRGDPNPP